MYLRYLYFLIFHDIIGHLLALFIYPIAYAFRCEIREKVKISKKKGIYLFLWWFLNDDYDYGDPYFVEKYFRGYSNFQMFILSYRWSAWRNPLQNHYVTHKIQGDYRLVKDSTYCLNKQTNSTSWRTIKTKDKNGIFKDKHGDYIDYENSILGSQRQVFFIGNKKYFRISKTILLPLKWANKLLTIEYKFGFENFNWAFQFHIGFKCFDNKAQKEYDTFLLLKNAIKRQGNIYY